MKHLAKSSRKLKFQFRFQSIPMVPKHLRFWRAICVLFVEKAAAFINDSQGAHLWHTPLKAPITSTAKSTYDIYRKKHLWHPPQKAPITSTARKKRIVAKWCDCTNVEHDNLKPKTIFAAVYALIGLHLHVHFSLHLRVVHSPIYIDNIFTDKLKLRYVSYNWGTYMQQKILVIQG